MKQRRLQLKALSLDELREAMQRNFEAHENEVRAYLLGHFVTLDEQQKRVWWNVANEERKAWMRSSLKYQP